MTTIVTVVRDPSGPLGKHFAADGSKRAAVTVNRGVARQIDCPTAADFAHVLDYVQSDPHAALILSSFPGIPAGVDFDLLSERELRQATGLQDVRSQVFRYPGGRYVTGRFIERVEGSDWILLDRDTDGQTPPQFSPECMPADAWLAAMECLLPGISCAPRVHVPSSSARVRWPNGAPVGSGNGHWYVQVQGGRDVERLKVAAEYNAIRWGMAWPWRNAGGASSTRTLCDLSVWTAGRLVFDGAPIADLPLRVCPSPVVVQNPAGSPLSIASIRMPSTEEFKQATRLLGAEKVIRGDGRSGIDSYDLPMQSLIETEDYGTISVAQCIDIMQNDGIDKLRCQTPFRESSSFAGVLRLGMDGKPALHDVGTGTTHWLSHGDYAAGIFQHTPGSIMPPPPQGASMAPLPPPPNKFAAATVPVEAKCAEPRPRAVIYQLIGEGSVSLLWGDAGTGKSTVAAAIARSIGSGLPFLGKPVSQGRVLYISTEGSIRRKFEADGQAPNVDILELVPNLLDPNDLDALIQHVATTGYKCVIFDVLSEVYAGDENDTGTAVRVMLAVKTLCRATGAATLLVHHSDKAGNAARGSGVFRNSCDNEFKAERVEGTDRRKLSIKKCRDGKDHVGLSLYEIETVDMGPDPDPIAPEGARLIATRVAWVDAQHSYKGQPDTSKEPPSRKPLRSGPPLCKDVLDVLTLHASGVTEQDWGVEFEARAPLPGRAAKTAFGKAIVWLSSNGYIRAELSPAGKIFKRAYIDEIAASGGQFAKFVTELPFVGAG